ncbi:hypothetical protein QQ39_10470 [Pragia fontium]|nr:hypothetical protein QQ39_10470 [Pragia fontium]
MLPFVRGEIVVLEPVRNSKLILIFCAKKDRVLIKLKRVNSAQTSSYPARRNSNINREMLFHALIPVMVFV